MAADPSSNKGDPGPSGGGPRNPGVQGFYGDQSASPARGSSGVICVASDPSAFIVWMDPSRVKAILEPSTDQDGLLSTTSTFVNCASRRV